MIPVNTPLLIGNEKKYILECIETGWISSEGPFVKKFEDNMASFVSRKHGIAVSSGSAALDVAIRALNLKKGSEVIMPTFTIISPAQSLVNEGLIPVLVDSNLSTWNMDVTQIEAKITSKTEAIIVVHIYGLPVDLKPVLDIAKKYNLKVIEDAAEMHGQEYNGEKCGSFGDISIFSFYPNKHITTGEGGMVLTNDDSLAIRCRNLKNLCFNPERRFVHDELGWNYRMTNMQAALGVAQLEQIDKIVKRKREIGNLYNERLKDFNVLQLPLLQTDYSKNIFWIFGLLAKDEKSALYIQEKLKEKRVGTRPFFWCMHEQPVFKKMNLFTNESYPVAEKIARSGFYIPSGLALTDEQINVVCDYIIEIIDNG